jgi:hypothetical protein
VEFGSDKCCELLLAAGADKDKADGVMGYDIYFYLII